MKEEFDILLAKDLDGSLSIEEKKRLKELYSEDDSYRHIYINYKKIKSVIHPPFKPESIDLDAAEDNVFRKILNNDTSQTKPVANKIIIWWQQIAAVLLIPLLFATVYLWINNRYDDPTDSMQMITSLPGTRSKVNLPDGSVVWLNSNSVINYPVQFDKNERRVTLEGEGYFIVDANKKRPFYINTNGVEVRVTGTELNVESYKNDSINRVMLVSGSASVATDNKEIVELKPDMCFSLNTLTNETNLFSADVTLYGKWRDGVLAFRDDSLEEVFKRVGRAYNVDIIVKDQKLANYKYRATFEHESLQQILEAIRLSAPIKYNYVRSNTENQSITTIEVLPG